MTIEDAIYEIKQLAVLSNEKNIDRITEALEMAIEALADRKTESQTKYPCDTCANKGDHDGECSNCVSDSETIRWKMPSHYKPKTEPSNSEKPNNSKEGEL